MKTCDKLTNLIMDYWYECIFKGTKADREVNDLIENFALSCGVCEENFDNDVESTVRFLTNSQKRRLHKMLTNSKIK